MIGLARSLAPLPAARPAVHQFTNIPPSETWGLAFAPSSEKLLLAVAGGSSNSVRVLDVAAKEQAAQLAMPESADKQRKEKFVLSVAYSPGVCGGGSRGAAACWFGDGKGCGQAACCSACACPAGPAAKARRPALLAHPLRPPRRRMQTGGG